MEAKQKNLGLEIEQNKSYLGSVEEAISKLKEEKGIREVDNPDHAEHDRLERLKSEKNRIRCEIIIQERECLKFDDLINEEKKKEHLSSNGKKTTGKKNTVAKRKRADKNK